MVLGKEGGRGIFDNDDVVTSIGGVSRSGFEHMSVAIPGMTERGYQRKLAAGVVCAAGSIGIMIPPSICMIIYAIRNICFTIN